MTDKEQIEKRIEEMVEDYKCCTACEMYSRYASPHCTDYKLPENCFICREQAEAWIELPKNIRR